jgi:hypothetical protein
MPRSRDARFCAPLMCASSITGTRSSPSFLAASTRPCPAMTPFSPSTSTGLVQPNSRMLAAICATWASEWCAVCGRRGSARPTAARRLPTRPSLGPHKRATNQGASGDRNSAVPSKSGRISPGEFRGHKGPTARLRLETLKTNSYPRRAYEWKSPLAVACPSR